ncbi:MAG: SMC-Scp complex subunit ScpB [Defluviitaleaceae bacterium]|nr:SMC-Scp complex subunit ScpB [Defluviitaleaceae bacterium]
MPKFSLEQQKILEAVLFAAGAPVELARLAEVLGCNLPVARNLLANMAEQYIAEESPIQLMEHDDAFQLCTNPKYYPQIARLLPTASKPTLTQPLLETLAIIAYKQPATKSIIEEIRGVNADHAVNKLLEYNLIIELGRLDSPGKPIIFGTSEAFLRFFGFRNVEDFLGEELNKERENADEQPQESEKAQESPPQEL